MAIIRPSHRGSWNSDNYHQASPPLAGGDGGKGNRIPHNIMQCGNERRQTFFMPSVLKVNPYTISAKNRSK